MIVDRMARLVQVKWLDSMNLNEGGWDDIEQFEESMSIEAMTHRTCGHLVSENDDAILVALSLYEDHSRAQGVVVIPKRSVLQVNELRIGEVISGKTRMLEVR